MSQFEPLPEDAIVYRSLLRKQWIDEDTGRVKADAYFLRVNEPGLSVNLASECTPQQCANLFRKCYGVASLEVKDVRETGLEIEQDSKNMQILSVYPIEKMTLLRQKDWRDY